MTKLTQSITPLTGLLAFLGVIGCATAATITGHLSGSDLLTTFAGVGLVGGTVGTAQVVGTHVTNAAAIPTAAPISTPTANVAPGGGQPQTV